MSFFRSMDSVNEDDWAMKLLDEGILPSANGYYGIGALKNSDILTAVSIVAGDVARFPLMKIKESDDSIVDDDNLNYLLNKQINDFLSSYHWRFSMMVNAILTGNSYTRIIRDNRSYSKTAGQPIELEFLTPSQVTINYRDTLQGREYYYSVNPVDERSSFDVEPHNMIHWKFFTSDGVMGRSPLLSLGDEMSMQKSGVETLNKFFKNGFKSGVLTLNGGALNTEARRKTRKEFERAQNDGGNGPIVIDKTMAYQPLEVDTSVLNLINSNNWSTSQIAKAMRIPAYKLAINSPNQSINQLTADYINSDLPFYFQPILSELEMKMLTDSERHKYRFDFDTRKQTARPVQELVSLQQNADLNSQEVRAELGMKPVKDKNLDRYQSTLNTVAMDMKDEYQKNNHLKGGDDSGTKNDSNTGNT